MNNNGIKFKSNLKIKNIKLKYKIRKYKNLMTL